MSKTPKYISSDWERLGYTSQDIEELGARVLNSLSRYNITRDELISVGIGNKKLHNLGTVGLLKIQEYRHKNRETRWRKLLRRILNA